MAALTVIVLSDTEVLSVGKTTLVAKMCNKPYGKNIGFDLSTLKDSDSNLAPLHVFNIESKKAIQGALKIFLSNANIVLICVDLSKPIQEDTLQKSVIDFRFQNHQNATFFLVGTKQDIQQPGNGKILQSIGSKMNFDEKNIFSTSAVSNDGGGISELKKRIFELAAEMQPTKPTLVYGEAVEEECTNPPISGTFFFDMVRHPAMYVMGGLFMIAGLMALGIGLACLCPALIPMMAGIGIVLTESSAIWLAVGGACGLVFGNMATFFYKNATERKLCSTVHLSDPNITGIEDAFPEWSGEKPPEEIPSNLSELELSP